MLAVRLITASRSGVGGDSMHPPTAGPFTEHVVASTSQLSEVLDRLEAGLKATPAVDPFDAIGELTDALRDTVNAELNITCDLTTDWAMRWEAQARRMVEYERRIRPLIDTLREKRMVRPA
jgi:hypothetical protein